MKTREPLCLSFDQFDTDYADRTGYCVQCRAPHGDIGPHDIEKPCRNCGTKTVAGVMALSSSMLIELSE